MRYTHLIRNIPKEMNIPTTKTIAKAGTIVLAGTLIAHALNYAFTIIMTRILEQEAYAVLVTIITIITIISIPLRTATTIAAKYTSFIIRGYASYVQATLILGIGILGVYVCLTPIMADWLKISPAALLAIGPIILVTPLLSMNMGLIQGMRRVAIFSWVPAGEATAKFAFAGLFVALGYPLYGALGAISLTVIISSIINTLIVAREHARLKEKNGPSSHIPKQWRNSAIIILVSSIATALLGNMDVLAAKHFFSNELATQYLVLAVITRTISYGSLIMIPVLFPAMAQALHPRDARILLKKGISTALATSLLILVLFALYPKQIITLLPGSQYDAVAPYLVLAGIATALWSCSQIFLSYFIATDTKRFLMPLLAITGSQMIGIALFHNSIQEILTVINVSEVLLLGVYTFLCLQKKR